MKTFQEYILEQSQVLQTVPFGKLGLGSVYHAGGVSSVESIDPFRLASKQNKKGRSYGGFYVGPLSHAKTYPGEHVMKIDINPNARVLVNQAPGDTDRISVDRLRSHL